ncbi:MAG: response regulator [Planctomycetota bacterium]|nr:response regulator [Planctomycetota bacterium]MDA1249120.1 response regulator [Planctomycetota bacterium]
MPTILVVDDLMSDRRIAGGLLKRDGNLEVVFAENGREALEQIEAHMPDLVLTDLQMPEMDGLGLVTEINAKYPLIPTILMTAAGSETVAREALERGAASYVPKQFLATELLETVQRVIAMSGEERLRSRLLNRLAESTWVIDNDPALVSGLVAHIRNLLVQRRVCSAADVMGLSTAIDEAMLNALYHGNLDVESSLKEQDDQAFHKLAAQRRLESPWCDRQITVTVRFEDGVRIVIRDEGSGFDPESLPDPTDPENLIKASGRGLLLMRAFMDDVFHNDSGNEVTLVKKQSPTDDE